MSDIEKLIPILNFSVVKHGEYANFPWTQVKRAEQQLSGHKWKLVKAFSLWNKADYE